MLSQEYQLLYAALRCGMWPRTDPIHRMQLFFVANCEFKPMAHVMSYQRCLENGVLNGLWDNHIKRGSGEYLITDEGHQMALDKFGPTLAPYSAARTYKFEIGLSGVVSDIAVELKCRGKKSWVYLDGLEYRSKKLACERLQSDTGIRINRPEFVSLYDMALDRGFDMYFNQG